MSIISLCFVFLYNIIAKKENKVERTYYELNPSQEVVKLQCQYTLFKRVINIMMSAQCEKIDFKLMKEAFNLAILRNDCTRIRFCKRKGKVVQYFEENVKFEKIPYFEFDSKEKQENFIRKESHHAIKYMKGEVIKPYFIKTYDNKNMVLLKVCHLILDAYGLNIFFKDLFEVYESLLNKTELPKQLCKFEDVIKKDLVTKNNKEFFDKNEEFFSKYLLEKPQPYYAGLHGLTTKLAKKKFNTHSMKMFFIKNDTQGYMLPFTKGLGEEILNFCKENSATPSNLIFYASSITLSKMNNEVENMLPLELCNARATALERNCAGTKVQSIGCYTVVNKNKSFKENFSEFCSQQNILYRHLGFSDMAFEKLLHKVYKKPLLETFYSLTYSFIPTYKPSGVKFQMYSNGKCALPAYLATLFDITTHEMEMVYDCQTKIINEQNVNTFHNNLMLVLKQIIENPTQLIKEIKIGD